MRKKRKKITQAKKNKSTQAQVRQLTQAILAQENATTIESILFFTQRKRLRCVRLNGNRALNCQPSSGCQLLQSGTVPSRSNSAVVSAAVCSRV